jgi:MscS family membrane protein
MIDSRASGPVMAHLRMKTIRSLPVFVGLFGAPLAWAQVAAAAAAPVAAPAPAGAPAGSASAAALNASTDVLEHFVDWLQLRIFPDGSHGELVHWIACGVLFLAAVLLRHVVTNFLFFWLKKLASKTETTLDDKLFPAMEQPVAALVMVLGIFGSLTVLPLSATVDQLINRGAVIAVLVVLFWGFLRAGGAILDHLEEVAHEKQVGLAHFMPLIKKALAALVIVFGVLMVIKSQGIDVAAVLTGLGIGGLAFAFAAQDTIANLFGSMVVVLDHPFKVGDYVKVGAHEGTVEDIGLRSTKLRTPARTLIVVPNKSMASEAVTNLSRMPQRRVDQTLGLTYDTTPEQMEAILADFRKLLETDASVAKDFLVVRFVGFGDSSLDIQVIYFTNDPDYRKHLEVRERINLAFMRSVAARGLSFAFPTQTLHVGEETAKRLAAK